MAVPVAAAIIPTCDRKCRRSIAASSFMAKSPFSPLSLRNTKRSRETPTSLISAGRLGCKFGHCVPDSDLSRSCASLGAWSFLLKNSRKSATPPMMAPAMAPVPARKTPTNKMTVPVSGDGCAPAAMSTTAKPTRNPAPAPASEQSNVRPMKHLRPVEEQNETTAA